MIAREDELRGAGLRPASCEPAIELTGRWRLSEHLALLPIVQYIRDSGGRAYPDAIKVMALRIELAFRLVPATS